MNRILASTLLLSSVLLPAVAGASPATDATVPAPRISTGIVPPRLINSLNFTYPASQTGFYIHSGTKVTATFVVDENGQPRDIKVVKGVDPFWNARIAESLKYLRYRPATIDNQPTPIAVNLDINVQ